MGDEDDDIMNGYRRVCQMYCTVCDKLINYKCQCFIFTSLK
jgi:hypothetical protein